MPLGQTLRRAREKKKLTRVALGRRARIAPETIEAIETMPGRSPRILTLRRLAKALGLRIEDLLT